MVYSDGEEGIKTKKKIPQQPKPPPLPSQHRQVSPQAMGKSKKNRVVDKSPRKAAFQNKGTTKSKLKHLNKRFSPSSMRAAISE